MLAHRDGVFVAKTVLLELEWVLRTACKLPRPDIHSAIGKLLGLTKLGTQSPGQVSQALDGCSRGLDFADALHLAASATDEGKFTLDARFVGVATAAGHDIDVWSAQVSASATAIKRIRPVAGDPRRANRVRR